MFCPLSNRRFVPEPDGSLPSLFSGRRPKPRFPSQTPHRRYEDVIHHRIRNLEADFVQIFLLGARPEYFDEFGAMAVAS